jgi:hypothetical protein
MIRARLYKGLRTGSMSLGSLLDDERIKMAFPNLCCYCGVSGQLSLDHMIPTARGGANTGDNVVWACRSCNSAKGAKDMLEWLAERESFPSLLLLRRYLKLAAEIASAADAINAPLDSPPSLPFSLKAIPVSFPPPAKLRLWVANAG